MRIEDFVKRGTELIAWADELLKTEYESAGYSWVDEQKFRGLRGASLSFLAATFGVGHAYYTEFDSHVQGQTPSDTRQGRGILVAARDELAGGWLNTTKAMVSAEIFADFLEMADHLLEQGYKDPAAVMAGGVLEEHLRQLCVKHNIEVGTTQHSKVVPKKADLLNAELAKAGAYSRLDHKSVTAWLELRNNAAHGKYSEYSDNQVAVMLLGISDFMSRVSL